LFSFTIESTFLSKGKIKDLFSITLPSSPQYEHLPFLDVWKLFRIDVVLPEISK